MEETYIIKSRGIIFKRYYIEYYHDVKYFTSKTYSDFLFSLFCNLPYNEYKNILKNKFNGKFNKRLDMVLYKNKDDAECAKDWIENTITGLKIIKILSE